MLKKIYQELVAIRKELHNLSNAMKPDSIDVIMNQIANKLHESTQDFHY